ncbi:MAG: NUDIX domain-containing protein [Planctomycetaceae bacterium]|nr:NUDIX domain-containing protein [Planctomycetaceae bacterium]
MTTRQKGHWVFPKGYIEPGETETGAALKEAWEEAGIRGRIVGDAVGTYERVKLGEVRRVVCFLMMVAQSRRSWKESELRERRWMSADDALIELNHSQQRAMLAAVLKRLERRRSRAG